MGSPSSSVTWGRRGPEPTAPSNVSQAMPSARGGFSQAFPEIAGQSRVVQELLGEAGQRLIRRAPGPADRRAAFAVLTDKGGEALDRALTARILRTLRDANA